MYVFVGGGWGVKRYVLVVGRGGGLLGSQGSSWVNVGHPSVVGQEAAQTLKDGQTRMDSAPPKLGDTMISTVGCRLDWILSFHYFSTCPPI